MGNTIDFVDEEKLPAQRMARYFADTKEPLFYDSDRGLAQILPFGSYIEIKENPLLRLRTSDNKTVPVGLFCCTDQPWCRTNVDLAARPLRDMLSLFIGHADIPAKSLAYINNRAFISNSDTKNAWNAVLQGDDAEEYDGRISWYERTIRLGELARNLVKTTHPVKPCTFATIGLFAAAIPVSRRDGVADRHAFLLRAKLLTKMQLPSLNDVMLWTELPDANPYNFPPQAFMRRMDLMSMIGDVWTTRTQPSAIRSDRFAPNEKRLTFWDVSAYTTSDAINFCMFVLRSAASVHNALGRVAVHSGHIDPHARLNNHTTPIRPMRPADPMPRAAVAVGYRRTRNHWVTWVRCGTHQNTGLPRLFCIDSLMEYPRGYDCENAQSILDYLTKPTSASERMLWFSFPPEFHLNREHKQFHDNWDFDKVRKMGRDDSKCEFGCASIKACRHVMEYHHIPMARMPNARDCGPYSILLAYELVRLFSVTDPSGYLACIANTVARFSGYVAADRAGNGVCLDDLPFSLFTVVNLRVEKRLYTTVVRKLVLRYLLLGFPLPDTLGDCNPLIVNDPFRQAA